MHFYSLHYSTSKCPVKYKKEKMAIVLTMNTFVNHITMMELQQCVRALNRVVEAWQQLKCSLAQQVTLNNIYRIAFLFRKMWFIDCSYEDSIHM